jgi:hypothetical protein
MSERKDVTSSQMRLALRFDCPNRGVTSERTQRLFALLYFTFHFPIAAAGERPHWVPVLPPAADVESFSNLGTTVTALGGAFGETRNRF